MDQNPVCISCRKPKPQEECGQCNEPVCRSCAFFVEDNTFAFLPVVAEELKHPYYCAYCHAETIEPALDAYSATLAAGKEVFFFFDGRNKPVRVLKRARETIEVPLCEDRDETILRMGFMAASLGFNAIVNADVACEKVRDHGFQKMKWHGTGWPAIVDADKLLRYEAQEQE